MYKKKILGQNITQYDVTITESHAAYPTIVIMFKAIIIINNINLTNLLLINKQ